MNLFSPRTQLTPTETQELLYAYTGPAPVAYGTRTRAVLENVIRPYKYYYKDENVPTALSKKTGEKSPSEINTRGPSSGFHRNSVIHFSRNLMEKYPEAFEKLQVWLDCELLNMEYAELAKGRQTLSFLQDRNLPAPIALEETIEFLQQNLNKPVGPSMVSYLNCIMEVLSMSETSYEYSVAVNTVQFEYEDDELEGMGPIKMHRETNMKKRRVNLSQEELWRKTCTLGTMWKHLERGRLNRRTIATPSMLARGFVKVVEDAARVLLEAMPSSGVPVGGEEKLAKLSSKLESVAEVTGELSGDQEKFNECLDPDAMRLMWTIFLSDKPQWVKELFNIPFLIFKSKIADIGEGLTYTKEGVVRRFPFGKYPSEFDELLPNIVKNADQEPIGVRCTLGMFMGMFNLSSTLLALIAADRKEITGDHVESSDDFIHFFKTKDHDELFKQAELLRWSLKLVGINMSPSKCVLISPAGIGEFNSKYHHRDFVGNVATDLPSLQANGKNPSSDLAMGLNVIRHSINTGQMNFISGDLALRIFTKAYKYAYLAEGETKRTRFLAKLNEQPLLTNQGAKTVHSVSTLHLDEICLRYKQGMITPEILGRLVNPENPITAPSEEAISFRPEGKLPMILEDTSVGNCFKYTFTRNRTITNKPHRTMLDKERKYKELTGLVESCFPETLIGRVDIPGTVRTACKKRIEYVIEKSDLPANVKDDLISQIK
ncbi:polymerase basic subunit 1 [Oz virus]|uniref:RNA-directed RNA polymerase catalytic subunit n=1 Tax=Oz virus TaxID=2137161 RepID=A0A2Z6BEV5_9ORTO|nr:polymerase basic subunit 1 [Oz virus]BBD20265.1 polymerase basic subunit 1 [Oz virus]